MLIKDMFDLMEKIGLKEARIEFSGGGDEGSAEEPEFEAEDGLNLEEVLSKLDKDRKVALDKALEELVEYKQGGGWYNGSFSSGTITVNVKDRSIVSDYYVEEPVSYTNDDPIDPDYDL